MKYQTRDIIIWSLIVPAVVLLAFYTAGAFFTSMMWGWDAIEPISFTAFPSSTIPSIFLYWERWLSVPGLSLTANNLYFFKLLLSTLLPFGFVAYIGYLFKAELQSIRWTKPKEELHGSAKWATQEDIKNANLRAENGLLLGKDDGGYLIADGFQHTLLFAPTGSGKGVGFVIPNLLFWKDSVVVHDIKLENYELTSGFRQKMGQQVFLWNPASPTGITHCYNPLDWISDSPGQQVDDVQKIGSLILPKQEFWTNEARALFVGVVLFLLVNKYKLTTFGEVVRTLRSDDVMFELSQALDVFGKDMHPAGYMNLAAFMQKAPKERSGVISHLNSALELWANPLIDAATAKSDFDIMSFKKIPTTVYVGLTPDNLQRLRPLMQVFYQQATEFLCREMPGPEDKHGVLFLMDEFPTLGKMEQFQSGIAYFRGYKVRLFLIVQDTEQLKGIYEESGMNSFLSNSTYRITFAANNTQTATLISQLIGNKTVEQKSVSAKKFTINPLEHHVSTSLTQRALLLPQEVISLPRDEQIMLIESQPPIRSNKIKYYEDEFLTSRLLPQTDVPTQEPFDVKKHGPQFELETLVYPTTEDDVDEQAA